MLTCKCSWQKCLLSLFFSFIIVIETSFFIRFIICYHCLLMYSASRKVNWIKSGSLYLHEECKFGKIGMLLIRWNFHSYTTIICVKSLETSCKNLDFFFKIGIHSRQGWIASTRPGVTRKTNTKRLKHAGIFLERTYS